MRNPVAICASAIIGWAYWLFPTLPMQTEAISAAGMIGVDTATGLLVAWQLRKMDAAKFSDVIRKTTAYALLLILLRLLPADIGTGGVAFGLSLIIFSEAFSALTKFKILGLNIPDWLLREVEKDGTETVSSNRTTGV